MTQHSQISATISRQTRKRLDTYVQSHGVKKGFLIEQAVLHHLQMLEVIPLDVIIPPKIIISSESGKTLVEKLEQEAAPTSAMQALFSGDLVE